MQLLHEPGFTRLSLAQPGKARITESHARHPGIPAGANGQ